jgi:hypothetical protein
MPDPGNVSANRDKVSPVAGSRALLKAYSFYHS